MSNTSPTSTSSATATLDAGSTFDSKDSPLFQHLKADNSPGAAGLYHDLNRCAGAVELPHANRAHEDERSLVKLVDISTSNTISLSYVLHSKQFRRDRQAQARHVNVALAQLQEPASDTHTRVVVLNRYASTDNPVWTATDNPLWTVDILLHLHIMIVELGISPAIAMGLLRPPHSFYNEGLSVFDAATDLSSRGLSLGPGVKSPFVDWQMSLIDLGECELGGQTVHLVVVCSDGPRHKQLLGEKLSAWASTVHIGHLAFVNFLPVPGPYSVYDWVQNWPFADFAKFMHPKEGGCATANPMSIWINALIRMICFRYSIRPWKVETSLSHLGDREHEHCCQNTAAHHQAAKMDLFKIELFLARHEQLTVKDCELALDKFRVIVEELRAEYEEMSASFERRSTLRSLDMTRLSIDESRSTIRLTWLATVFVPISLASSIFGMNVREIDTEKTGIWQFAATATVLLALSAYSWCLMRALRNYRLCVKRVHPTGHKWAISPLRMYYEFYKSCDKSHTKALVYLLGLKRADELGFGIFKRA